MQLSCKFRKVFGIKADVYLQSVLWIMMKKKGILGVIVDIVIKCFTDCESDFHLLHHASLLSSLVYFIVSFAVPFWSFWVGNFIEYTELLPTWFVLAVPNLFLFYFKYEKQCNCLHYCIRNVNTSGIKKKFLSTIRSLNNIHKSCILNN